MESGNSNGFYDASIATIGGTFDTFHSGHEKYIQRAFQFSHRVLIYVNTNEFAQKTKNYIIKPYEERTEKIDAFLYESGYEHRYKIHRLESNEQLKYDFLKNSKIRNNIALAVVIPKYLQFFRKLNLQRIRMGLNDFIIMVKEPSLDENHTRISSTRIRSGKMKDLESGYFDVKHFCNPNRKPPKNF